MTKTFLGSNKTYTKFACSFLNLSLSYFIFYRTLTFIKVNRVIFSVCGFFLLQLSSLYIFEILLLHRLTLHKQKKQKQKYPMIIEYVLCLDTSNYLSNH